MRSSDVPFEIVRTLQRRIACEAHHRQTGLMHCLGTMPCQSLTQLCQLTYLKHTNASFNLGRSIHMAQSHSKRCKAGGHCFGQGTREVGLAAPEQSPRAHTSWSGLSVFAMCGDMITRIYYLGVI